VALSGVATAVASMHVPGLAGNSRDVEALIAPAGAFGPVWAVLIELVAEEAFFRRWLFAALRRRLGARWATVASAAAFAVAHGEAASMLLLFATGVVLAEVYRGFGLAGSVGAHVALNGVALFLSAV
jgi:membrane protease YdiL (CAAX protease family)